jgi:hypothetical protein
MARKPKVQVQAEKEMALFEKNYATNESVAERAHQHVIEMIRAARNGRRSKEEEWIEDLRLWSCQNSDSQMYIGRSNLIIPELHNQVETSVSQLQQALFPNADYLGVIPMKQTQEDDAEDIKAAVFHELDHKNNLPSLMERFQRQKVLYGTAFLKPVFEKQLKTVVARTEKGYNDFRQVPKFQGVKVHCMDTFRAYVYPETVVTAEEALIAFDESFVPKHVLEDMDVYHVPSDLGEVHPDFMDVGWVDTVRMSIANLATASAHRKHAVLVTECWCDFDIVKGERVPCVITLANYSKVIRVQRNPFWHQSKPYIVGRYMKGPAGEFYGHSLPERMRSLQYMMTDLGNQTMDSLTYSLNPIALIDPGFAGDVNSFKLQPGAKWFASPQGVKFETFPDISATGFQGLQQIRGMIQQFSDNSPNIAPQLSGKVRSATQAATVQNQVSANMKALARSDEFEVLAPLADMTHWLLKQFQTEEYQIVVQGPEKGEWITKQINPEVLHKDCLLVWRGTEVAEKTAVRNQQLLSAYNMALQTSSLMPGQIDMPKLLKEVMNEAFGLKDLGIFIEDQKKKTIDPELENQSLSMGEEVEVHLGDNFEGHMETHRKGYQEAETPEARIAYLRHMEKHEVQKKAKDILQQQQAQISSLQSQMGEEGGQESTFAREGNPFSAPSSDANIMQGVRAVQPNTPKSVGFKK